MYKTNQFRVAAESVVRSRISLFVIVVLALLVPVFVPGQLVRAKSAVGEVSRIGSSNLIPSGFRIPVVPPCRFWSGKSC